MASIAVEGFRGDIDEHHLYHVIAWCSGNAAGLCQLADMNEECVVLQSLIVRPDYRRKGVGRRIVEWCIAHARMCDKAAISLCVKRGNAVAVEWYKRMGFHVSWTSKEDLYMTLRLK